MQYLLEKFTVNLLFKAGGNGAGQAGGKLLSAHVQYVLERKQAKAQAVLMKLEPSTDPTTIQKQQGRLQHVEVSG